MDPDIAEVKAPIVLLAVGLVIAVIHGIVSEEYVSVGMGLTIELLSIAIFLALAIPSSFLTAKILGTGLGYLKPAILKLAAIAAFPSAIASILPGFIAWFFFWIAYFGLIMWFFELEWWQAVVFVIVLWILNLVVLFSLFSIVS